MTYETLSLGKYYILSIFSRVNSIENFDNEGWSIIINFLHKKINISYALDIFSCHFIYCVVFEKEEEDEILNKSGLEISGR